jgi:hypothetical protein
LNLPGPARKRHATRRNFVPGGSLEPKKTRRGKRRSRARTADKKLRLILVRFTPVDEKYFAIDETINAD